MRKRTDPTPTPPRVPDTLTVVLIDTTTNYISIVHENEWRPYTRRTVQIKLTEEQRRALTPQHTGTINGETTHERILQAWLEPVYDEEAPTG